MLATCVVGGGVVVVSGVEVCVPELGGWNIGVGVVDCC